MFNIDHTGFAMLSAESPFLASSDIERWSFLTSLALRHFRHKKRRVMKTVLVGLIYHITWLNMVPEIFVTQYEKREDVFIIGDNYVWGH